MTVNFSIKHNIVGYNHIIDTIKVGLKHYSHVVSEDNIINLLIRDITHESLHQAIFKSTQDHLSCLCLDFIDLDKGLSELTLNIDFNQLLAHEGYYTKTPIEILRYYYSIGFITSRQFAKMNYYFLTKRQKCKNVKQGLNSIKDKV